MEQTVLIDIFNGGRRRLGVGETDEIFIQLYHSMLTRLREFPNSSLYVYLAIAFYMNKKGWCYPMIDTIAANIGKNKSTVSQAIDELCKIKIDGYRIFLRVAARTTEGKLASNRYLINPSPADVLKYDNKVVIIDEDGEILGTEEEYLAGEYTRDISTKVKPVENETSSTELTGKDFLAKTEPEDYDEGYYTELLNLYHQAKEKGKTKLVSPTGSTLTPQKIVGMVIAKLYGEFSYNGPLLSNIIKAADGEYKAIQKLGIIRKSLKKDLEGGKLAYLLACVKNYTENPQTFKNNGGGTSVKPQVTLNNEVSVNDQLLSLSMQIKRAREQGNSEEVEKLVTQAKSLKEGKNVPNKTS